MNNTYVVTVKVTDDGGLTDDPHGHGHGDQRQ